MTNPTPIAADVEQIADAVVEKLLAKVPFGSLVEAPLEDALNQLVAAAVAKVEAEIEAKFHI